MSKSTFAATKGAASAVLHLLANKEQELRAELAKIEQVRGILAGETLPAPAIPVKHRGRPKKAKP